MSEAAERGREARQHWAVPGSQHDRLVRFAKIALPAAVGVLIVFLALAPLDKNGDVTGPMLTWKLQGGQIVTEKNFTTEQMQALDQKVGL